MNADGHDKIQYGCHHSERYQQRVDSLRERQEKLVHAAKASEAYHAARNKDLEAAWGELAAKEKAVHAGSRAAAMTARAVLIKEHRTQAKELVR
jgi:peptidoglycan hydrolase CwlO-like protein